MNLGAMQPSRPPHVRETKETDMIKDDNALDANDSARDQHHDSEREDPLADINNQVISKAIPSGVDRRTFLMRNAVGGAAAVMTGTIIAAEARTAKALATLPVLQQQGNPTPPLESKAERRAEGERACADDCR
jgi:hypothetical protein